MSVLSANIPAIAGGRPMFDERVPIVSPEGLPGEEFLRDVRKILDSRQLTNATFVRQFEEAAEEYLGVAHCVAVSSCTAGLVLTLQALELQGEVILPSFTFHATAHSVLWNGLKPVFADCDPETFCIDPHAVKHQVSPDTAAILAVHLFGNPASIVELRSGLGGPERAHERIPRSPCRARPSRPRRPNRPPESDTPPLRAASRCHT